MAQEPEQVQLPVTRVVLYTNGVGYFEHSGTISGSQVFNLPVGTDDMDDLLQSLVLLDHDGGSIRAVRYAAGDPLPRTLSSYALDLSGNPDLADLLLQARGEEVRVESAQTVTGVIISVERVQQFEAADRHFLLLATDDGLRRIALDEVRQLEFSNAELREQMDAALLAIARHRDDDVREVRLEFSGDGERQVTVGYVREMPVWKTSYRMVLTDGGQAELQGWAIFDNPTPLDLQDVQVTFVAGQPVSFITSLYEAVYVQRQRFAPPTGTQAAAAAVYDAPMPAVAAAAPMMGRAFEAEALDTLMNAGVEAMASGVSSGVTFQYTVNEPVTVSRFESAMIPIVQQQIPAQNLSLFDPQRGETHPLRAVLLDNQTGLHLAAGTVTVFDGGTFTGTARMGDVLPGSSTLLAFATDLSVEVAVSGARDREQVLSVRLVDGVLISEVRNRYRTSYEFIGTPEENRLIAVEHPRNSGFELTAPENPAPVTTASSYRFGVLLAADQAAGDVTGETNLPVQLECNAAGSCVLTVTEEQVSEKRVMLQALSTDALVALLQDGPLDEETQLLLEQLLETGRRITALQQQLDGFDRQRQVIFEEQERIRANMASLDQSSSLYQRYVTQLNDQEDELESIAGERAAVEEQLMQAQEERAELLRRD